MRVCRNLIGEAETMNCTGSNYPSFDEAEYWQGTALPKENLESPPAGQKLNFLRNDDLTENI